MLRSGKYHRGAGCNIGDITTNDGAKHIIFNDEVYLYSSADDAIWYNIDNADQLRSDIEALVK